LLAYRRVLAFIDDRYIKTGLRSKYLGGGDKFGLIRDLRSRCPEEMLPWLDAAVLLTPDKLDFPYLFGSGGNDGRLDFSVNFAARALDVCGDKPIADAKNLLLDALNDTNEASLLSDVAIGQFSPRHAGGANATTGFDAVSLVNPWDYVLMMEGSLLFAGSIGRRTDASPGRPTFPFALRGVAGGYGSASGEEQERGEMWLPVWDGFASLTSVADLLRKGRLDLPTDGSRSIVRSAAIASDAVTAALTMGASLGLRSMSRIAFVQRNGLAYSAAPIGIVNVGQEYDGGIAILSAAVAKWVQRLHRSELGVSARERLRAFDDELFSFPNKSGGEIEKARARQELLACVADIDRAVGRSRMDVPPAPRLGWEIIQLLDDKTPAHRCALAVASLGGARTATDTRDELRLANGDPIKNVRTLIEKRVRKAASDPYAGWLKASYTLSVADIGEFLSFDHIQRLRFNRLLRAYSLIRLSGQWNKHPEVLVEATIPAAYAVLKLVFDDASLRDERIIRLLFAGNAQSALRLAVQRARACRDLQRPIRDVSGVVLDDPQWAGVALALPVERTVPNYIPLFNAALTSRIVPNEFENVRDYLETTGN
jgi:hypothetical protein